MKNGILIIGIAWLLSNILSFIFFGIVGAILSTHICSAIVWFGRKKLSTILNI